ncbi:MAG TPA: PepSY domain-containing protein [Pyrinomonadaceae bacterium]|nr:PepSY domain-containing protein [Pyrinomonadaceae bacterium]
MKKNFVLAVFISALLTGGSLVMAKSRGQENANEAKLARQAKITKEQAQETALKRAPGTVEGAELEKEHGKLVYSFDIRNAKGTIDEVQVSAITGKVVRVEHENKKQEAAEKKADQKKKP